MNYKIGDTVLYGNNLCNIVGIEFDDKLFKHYYVLYIPSTKETFAVYNEDEITGLYNIRVKFDTPSSYVFDRTEWDCCVDADKIIITPKEKGQT